MSSQPCFKHGLHTHSSAPSLPLNALNLVKSPPQNVPSSNMATHRSRFHLSPASKSGLHLRSVGTCHQPAAIPMSGGLHHTSWPWPQLPWGHADRRATSINPQTGLNLHLLITSIYVYCNYPLYILHIHFWANSLLLPLTFILLNLLI